MKLSASVGTEATQQQPHGTPSQPPLAVCRSYGWAGPQGVFRVRPAEFTRPKQVKIWPCGGMALHRNASALWACEKEMRTPKSQIIQFSPESAWTFWRFVCTAGPGWPQPADNTAQCQLSRARSLAVREMKLVVLPLRGQGSTALACWGPGPSALALQSRAWLLWLVGPLYWPAGGRVLLL